MEGVAQMLSENVSWYVCGTASKIQELKKSSCLLKMS